MIMEKELKKYLRLNNFALKNGVVLFGEGIDIEIPAGELAQSFELNYPVYNRSFVKLNLENSIELYDSCIKNLTPNTVLLHIGTNDILLFNENKVVFEQKYNALIEHIKTTNKGCRIVVVSVNNETINKELRYIADSSKCEYGDLTSIRVWNPQTTKIVTKFIQAMGVKTYYKSKPIYDILKIFFNYQYLICNK